MCPNLKPCLMTSFLPFCLLLCLGFLFPLCICKYNYKSVEGSKSANFCFLTLSNFPKSTALSFVRLTRFVSSFSYEFYTIWCKKFYIFSQEALGIFCSSWREMANTKELAILALLHITIRGVVGSKYCHLIWYCVRVHDNERGFYDYFWPNQEVLFLKLGFFFGYMQKCQPAYKLFMVQPHQKCWKKTHVSFQITY